MPGSSFAFLVYVLAFVHAVSGLHRPAYLLNTDPSVAVCPIGCPLGLGCQRDDCSVFYGCFASQCTCTYTVNGTRAVGYCGGMRVLVHTDCFSYRSASLPAGAFVLILLLTIAMCVCACQSYGQKTVTEPAKVGLPTYEDLQNDPVHYGPINNELPPPPAFDTPRTVPPNH